MKSTMILGVVLISLGLAVLVFQGISYTASETVAEMGPLELERETEERIPISPIAGGIAIVAGFVLVLVGRRK